jgi:hypothetical protein
MAFTLPAMPPLIDPLRVVTDTGRAMPVGSIEAGVSGRDLIDRLVLEMPGVAGWVRKFVVRMQLGALRRRLVKLWVGRGFAALARNDLELVLQAYDPAVELWVRGMDGAVKTATGVTRASAPSGRTSTMRSSTGGGR